MIDWKELRATAGNEPLQANALGRENALDWKDVIPSPAGSEQLSVGAYSSKKEIRQAYRRLAILHHPDLQPEHRRYEAEQRMKQLNEAYRILRQGNQA